MNLFKSGFISKFIVCRTDFYHIKESPDDRLGFPAGITHKLLLDVSVVYTKFLENLKNKIFRFTENTIRIY